MEPGTVLVTDGDVEVLLHREGNRYTWYSLFDGRKFSCTLMPDTDTGAYIVVLLPKRGESSSNPSNEG